MDTTTHPAPTTNVDPWWAHHAREEVANSLCTLAAKMPYCSEDDALVEWARLDRRVGLKHVRFITGINSVTDLLDRAIVARAAAETSIMGAA